MSASDKLEGVFEKAVKELEQVMGDTKPLTEKTKIAIQSIGIYGRLKSQENARYSLQYKVIKDITKNQDELRDYIQSTAPELKIVKKLK